MGTSKKSAVLTLFFTLGSWTLLAAQQGATDGQWRYYGGHVRKQRTPRRRSWWTVFSMLPRAHAATWSR